MREIRSYGSVRGALGNQSPYRDWHFVGLFKLRADFIGALRRAQVFDFGNGTVWQNRISRGEVSPVRLS
jgi:hypothetical protein